MEWKRSQCFKDTDSNCLVSGYCRQGCDPNGYIPDTTLDLILSYYPQFNGTTSQWKIEDNYITKEMIKLLNQPSISNSNIANDNEDDGGNDLYYDANNTFVSDDILSFDSDYFDVGLPNKMFLRLCPNCDTGIETHGQNATGTSWNPYSQHAQNANCVLEERNFVLKLMSFPLESQNDGIIFHVELYLHRMVQNVNKNNCKENNYNCKINNYNNECKQLSTIWKMRNSQNQYRGSSENRNNEFISFNWVIGNGNDIVDFINGNNGYDTKNSFDNFSGFMFECRIRILKFYGYSQEFIICNETEQTYYANPSQRRVYPNGDKDKNKDENNDKEQDKQLKFRFGW